MGNKLLIGIITISSILLIAMGVFMWFYINHNKEAPTTKTKEADKLYITYKFKEAIPIYEEYFDSLTIPQKINLSDSYFKTGDSARASYILEDLMKEGQVSPDYITLFYLKAAGQNVLLEKPENAFEYYKKAIKYGEQTSHAEQLKKEYVNFIVKNPYKDGLKKAIEYLEHMTTNTEQKYSAEAFYQLGELYYYDDNANRALLNWNKALEKDKKHVKSMEKIAMLYLSLEYYDDSFKMYEKIREIDRNNWQAYLGIADYYFIYKKDKKKSKNFYQEALYYNNKSDYSRLQLAHIYMEEGNKKSALDMLGQIVKNNSSENLVKQAEELIQEIGDFGFVPI